jgi:broad-specificity NMP kinase
MTAILVTGMSGAGKSTVLAELGRRGHRVVDTDYDGWTEEVPLRAEAGTERLWREDRIDALLRDHRGGPLFVSGCVRNQARFYPRFSAVVLLRAPADVILERVTTRTTNDYGKSDAERDHILSELEVVEPLLRAGATAEIDTRQPLDAVADALERIAARAGAVRDNARPGMESSTTGNARLRDFARRYTAAWCSQDPTRVAEHYAPEGSLTINGGTPSVGRAAITEAARSFMTAFPDMQVFMDGLVVKDDIVEYHWTLDGTNTGPGGTGKHVRISGYEAWTIGDDGLVAESQGQYDEAEYERQLQHGVSEAG